MKYMPQDIFDFAAMHFAAAKILGEDKYQTAIEIFTSEFNKQYIGDDWLSQLDQISIAVVRMAETCYPKDPVLCLRMAAKVRKEYDADMKIKAKLKKMFSGSLFSKDHPNPTARPITALVNCRSIIQSTAHEFLKNK